MPPAEQGTDGSSNESGGNTLLLVLAVGALVAAAAIGGALWARSRNQGGEATPADHGHEPGTGPTGPTGPGAGPR